MKWAAARQQRHRDRVVRDYDRLVSGPPPVVIFQMGKVASSTIYHSLLNRYDGLVLHAHLFGPLSPDPLAARLATDYRAGLPVRFISLTREPIERNISDFFENFERYVGEPFERQDRSTQELREIFLERFPHQFPAQWFETRFAQGTTIDVYKTPFPHSGSVTIAAPGKAALIMRSELADAEKVALVAQFTEVDGLELIPQNIGTDKRYGPAYRRFREEAKFPPDFVDAACSTRYYRHFYGPQWADRSLQRWSGTSSSV